MTIDKWFKDFMSLVCTGLILEDWIWYLTHPTLQITKLTTKMTCLCKKWLVNYILISLEKNYLAVYLNTLHSTQHGRLASIMEIGPRFIDPFPSKSHLDWPEIASKSQSVVRAQLSLWWHYKHPHPKLWTMDLVRYMYVLILLGVDLFLSRTGKWERNIW